MSEAQRQLRVGPPPDTAALLAAIVESSDDAIISKTLDGTVTSWNAAAQRLFGYAADEAVGKAVTLILPPDRLDEEAAILERLRRGERVEHYQTVRVAKDGCRVDVSLTISPVKDAAGRIVGASTIARDITEQKRAQQELRDAKEAAQSASRAKDHFLAVLSHELRTPLTPVLAAATFMQADARLAPDQREQLGMIRRNVELQARIIDDLLDLTKISRNKVAFHNEVLDAHAAVRNALDAVRGAAADKQLDVSVELAAARHHVWGDPARVQQILGNLLCNAVKFTPPGGRVGVRASNDGQDRLVVEVSDTGVGIDADVLPKVFNAFEQGEQTVTRQFGGLGLGLTISKALVDMHHGTLSASSKGKGRGATFTLCLNTVPTPHVEQPQRPAPGKAPRLAGVRVLLVEDHQDTLHVMGRLLRSLGCAVETATSVRSAVALAERASFDLLISDMGLPDGSGLEVMRRMTGKGPVRGIALTGLGTEEDVRQSREAGFETHLTKPVDFQTLEAVVRRLAS